MAIQESFSSKYFELKQVADGVYAAIIRKGTGAMGNAALVDLGDRTLVFDTFFIPQAAEDLRCAAELLFRRKVTLVINSHWHNDHVRGNQAFPDASIVATQITRDLFRERGPQFLEIAKKYPDYPKQVEEQALQEQDEVKRKEMLDYAGDIKAFSEVIDTIKLRFPDVIFEQELVFYGSKRTARLLTYGGGHTQSDAFLFLPDDHVILMGDLLSVQNHNQFKVGDALEWVRILKKIEQLPIEKAVPGHGPVGNFEDIVTMRRYFEELLQRAEELFANGATPEQAGDVDIPVAYQNWEVADLYRQNIKQLLEQNLAKTATTAPVEC